MPVEIADSSLKQRTLELLRDRKGSLLKITEDTGIGFWWLRAFLDGRIPDPSVRRVQALYEYLNGSALKV